MNDHFKCAFYTALHFETGGLFNPTDNECINGTNRKKCGTSGGKLDRGGNTKFGISQRSYPNLDIDSIDLKTAEQIYYNDYWIKSKCDKVNYLIGGFLFDTSCTSGISASSKILQRSVGTEPDGIIGKITLEIVNKLDFNVVLSKMVLERCKLHENIIKNNKSQEIYLKGWNNRANNWYNIYNEVLKKWI